MIQEIIKKEADEYLRKVGSVDRKDIIEHDFTEGMKKGLEHMDKIIKWFYQHYDLLGNDWYEINHSRPEWRGKEKLTTTQLIDKYFTENKIV